MKRDSKEFQGLIEQIVRTLREELRHHRRFRDLVREKKEARDSALPSLSTWSRRTAAE